MGIQWPFPGRQLFTKSSLFGTDQVGLSVKFYSVGEFSRNNKRGKPPLEWKCYNFRGKE